MIAELAAAERTGARGLVSAIEKVLIPFEKTLPSTGIKKILVTPEVVGDPDGQLKVMVNAPDSPEAMERFERARIKELEDIKSYILGRSEDFERKSAFRFLKKEWVS